MVSFKDFNQSPLFHSNPSDLSDIFKYSSVRRFFQNSDSGSDYSQHSTTHKSRGGGVGNFFNRLRQPPSGEGGVGERRNIPFLQPRRCGGGLEEDGWSEVSSRRTTKHNPIKQIIEYFFRNIRLYNLF